MHVVSEHYLPLMLRQCCLSSMLIMSPSYSRSCGNGRVKLHLQGSTEVRSRDMVMEQRALFANQGLSSQGILALHTQQCTFETSHAFPLS